jgi:hypothetical protein
MILGKYCFIHYSIIDMNVGVIKYTDPAPAPEPNPVLLDVGVGIKSLAEFDQIKSTFTLSVWVWLL